VTTVDDFSKEPKFFDEDDPEDPAICNRDRAEFAAAAVQAFGERVGLVSEDGEVVEEWEDLLGDLIGDLRHFCDGHGIDWIAVLNNGNFHYHYEVDPRRFEDPDNFDPTDPMGYVRL
jgi:hypothetical protein